MKKYSSLLTSAFGFPSFVITSAGRLLTAFCFLLPVFSCGKKKHIISQGTTEYLGEKWKQEYYTDHDSAFEEYRYIENGQLFMFKKAASEKEMNDSTYSSVFWYRTMKVMETRSYEKKIPTDTWMDYYRSGKKRSQQKFENGKLITLTQWYENGNTDIESHSAPDGKMVRNEFFENGNPEQQLNIDSIGNGTCANFFSNGKKQSEGNVVNKSAIGIWHRWDSLGNSLPDTLCGISQFQSY
ncbi:MAG: hypothetical protein HY064_14065 [Bacteroidetes bacterium]|nr:hypothetical protein [Bacteroidota bacterium]